MTIEVAEQPKVTVVETMPDRLALPVWTLIAPGLGLVAVLFGLAKMGSIGTAAAIVVLIASVLAAVHHAEVIAHKVGEPFGTLVLAIAVTVIEVSLIVSLMLSDAGDAAALARDTVFAAIMIILNFIIGLCLLAGAVRHHEQLSRSPRRASNARPVRAGFVRSSRASCSTRCSTCPAWTASTR